jgi:hypothetical protein
MYAVALFRKSDFARPPYIWHPSSISKGWKIVQHIRRISIVKLTRTREEVRSVATGQFNFPPLAQLEYIDRHFIVLDHTPLVGASAGAAYRWKTWQFTFDGLFSSGLRGGFANRTQLPKLWQFNLSAAKTLDVPMLGRIENRIILLNVFDRINLIRPATGIGVFQSAYGPRITVFDALTIPLPPL